MALLANTVLPHTRKVSQRLAPLMPLLAITDDGVMGHHIRNNTVVPHAREEIQRLVQLLALHSRVGVL